MSTVYKILPSDHVSPYTYFCKFSFVFLRKLDNHWKRKRLLLHVQAMLSRCLVHCILKINNCTNADNLGKFVAIWYKTLSCVLEWVGLLDLEFLFLLASGVMRWLIFKFSCCFNYHFFCYIYDGRFPWKVMEGKEKW